MIPLRIVVRTRTPWETMTVEQFIGQREPQNPTEFIRIGRKLIPALEEAKGIDYFQYRARIRDACRVELAKTGLPITEGIDRIDWDSEDEAIIPIDDDDVLFQSASSVADRFSPDVNLVVWRRLTNYLGTDRLENPNFGGQLDTCNWAIRKSFLRENFNYSDRTSILARHWHAAGILSPRLGGKPRPTDLLGRALKALTIQCGGVKLSHPSIVELQEVHSVYFLHIGSISFLAHKMTEVEDPIPYFRKLPIHPLLEAQCT